MAALDASRQVRRRIERSARGRIELVADHGIEWRYYSEVLTWRRRLAGAKGMVRGMRRRGLVLSLAAMAGGLLCGGWLLLGMRSYRTALVEVRAQIQAG